MCGLEVGMCYHGNRHVVSSHLSEADTPLLSTLLSWDTRSVLVGHGLSRIRDADVPGQHVDMCGGSTEMFNC